MTPWCNQQHSNLITWYKQNTWNLVTTRIRNWYFALSDRNDCTLHTQTEEGTAVSWQHTYEWRWLLNIQIRTARQYTTVLQFPYVSLLAMALGPTDTNTRSANMYFLFSNDYVLTNVAPSCTEPTATCTWPHSVVWSIATAHPLPSYAAAGRVYFCQSKF